MQVVHLARLVVRVLRRLAETGLRADERLYRPPRPPRPVEDLVVEARRHHERERVEPAVDVVVHARPRVLAFDAHAVADGLGARADVRDPVDLHQTVGTPPRHAEQAACAVVLERAPRDRDAGCRQRRTDRVALERLDRPPVEREGDRPVAPDGLAGTRWEPFGHAVEASSPGSPPPDGSPSPSPGQNVRRTSFVPVCRSARNHFRHPSRCSHHSVCQPLTFSRKNRYPASSRSDAPGPARRVRSPP